MSEEKINISETERMAMRDRALKATCNSIYPYPPIPRDKPVVPTNTGAYFRNMQLQAYNKNKK
jgi:hypothetical protein